MRSSAGCDGIRLPHHASRPSDPTLERPLTCKCADPNSAPALATHRDQIMLTRLAFSDSRRFSSDWPAHVDAHNSATHACYWLWAYTPSIDLVEEAPWLVAFIKKTLEFWLGEAAKRDRGENGNGSDGLVYADLDAIAECADVLRSVLVIGEAATGVDQKQVDAAASARGLSELPPLLERASAWLMGMQGTDGSWPHFPFPLHDPMRTRLVRLPSPDAIDEYSTTYDALHATWTATMALCDRRGAIATSPAWRHGERVRRLMRDVTFQRQEVPKKVRHRK